MEVASIEKLNKTLLGVMYVSLVPATGSRESATNLQRKAVTPATAVQLARSHP